MNKRVQLVGPTHLLFYIKGFNFNIYLYSFFTADVSAWTTTESLHTYLPPMNTTYTPPYNTTQEPQGNDTTDLLTSTETSVTVALSTTSSVLYNSSQDLQWTSSAPHPSMSSADSPLPATTCGKKCFIFISRLLTVKSLN